MEEIFDINLAYKYLKDSYIIKTYSSFARCLYYFYIEGKNIIFLSNSFKTIISKDDFFKDFKDYNFSLVYLEEEIVDIKKDQEYYSWGKKM